MSDEYQATAFTGASLFRQLNITKIGAMSALLKLKTYARGDVFGYGEGSTTSLSPALGEGKDRRQRRVGWELVKDILTAPDIFGDLSLKGSLSPDEYAVALTAGTVVGCFAIADFKKILEDHPRMALDYAHTVNNKLRKLEEQAFRPGISGTPKYRLIRFIKSWALSDGSRIGNKIILPNYLTHSDIAGVIATSGKV